MRMMDVDPTKRITASAVLQSDWMRSANLSATPLGLRNASTRETNTAVDAMLKVMTNQTAPKVTLMSVPAGSLAARYCTLINH